MALLLAVAVMAPSGSALAQAEASAVQKVLSGPPSAASGGSPVKRGARERLRAVVRAEAEATDLPADIADAVANIESDYNPDAVGTVGEIGLMQVRPTTAAMLGFTGLDLELADPKVNARFGVAYLAGAWRLAKGDLCETLMRYRAGHGEATMTDRSVLYCWRARNYLRSIGSPYGNITVPREDRIQEIIAAVGAGGGGRLSPLWMRLERAFAVRLNPDRSGRKTLAAGSFSFSRSATERAKSRHWSNLRAAFAQRRTSSEAD